MRSKFFTFSVFLLGLVCFANVAFSYEIGSQEVNISASQTYVTKYIWRGQDVFGDNDGAYQPSIDISLPKFLPSTDVSLNVWGAFPTNSGHEDAEELDYTLSLSTDIYDILNLSYGYTYFDYPNTASASDVQESWISLTLNEIPALPIDVALTLFAAYEYEAEGGGIENGWYYSWGFSTELPLPEIGLFQEGQALGFSIVNWGNDGVCGLEPSFLYATDFSLSTSYSFAGVDITPSINYTANYEEQINNGDEELWGAIELSYAF